MADELELLLACTGESVCICQYFLNRTCSWHSKHFLINGQNSIIAHMNLLPFHMNYLSNYQIKFTSCAPIHNNVSHSHFHLFNVIAHNIVNAIHLKLMSFRRCVRAASTIYHKTITCYCHCMSEREICWAIK